MKTINKDALKAQLLAAGMSEEQANAMLAASEQDATPDPALSQIQETLIALEKGIKKGDLKIEHEDDDGDEYEIEAEDDDEAESEMNARSAAKGMAKGILLNNVEGIISTLLKTNAQLHKALKTERAIFLAKVEKAIKGAGGEEIASLKATLEAQGNTLAEIKKGLAMPEAPRGLTASAPVRHPAEPAPAADVWTDNKLAKAIMNKMGGWTQSKREKAREALLLTTVGGVSLDKIAADFGLTLADANN